MEFLTYVEIIWKHNNQTISNSSFVSIYEGEVIHEGELMHQSFLQICNVTTVDAGTCTCIVSNGETLVNSSTELIVLGSNSLCILFINIRATLFIEVLKLLSSL